MTAPEKTRSPLARLFMGADHTLDRLLAYWFATCAFYMGSLAVLVAEILAGTTPPQAGLILIGAGMAGVTSFYLLVRFSQRLGLEYWQLALYQAVWAMGCIIAAYAITGPIRGASMSLMLVVMVFCTFALRPRQAVALAATAVVCIGVTMWCMARLDPAQYPPAVELMNFILIALGMSGVTGLSGAMNRLRSRLKEQKAELQKALERIQTLATIDELTALANRRHAHAVLSAEEERIDGAPGPVCVALLDLDHFKLVNDRYGHACGDAVLRAFADAARPEVRNRDLFARWGGEEFLVMLPDTRLDDAHRVVARMKERVASVEVEGVPPALRITFSAGVVQRKAGEPLSDAITRADQAMYTAKSTGRDRVIAA